jgi:release factor glutamine methyltransferase
MAALKLGDYLQLVERELREGPHPDRAHQDAELLMGHMMGKARTWLFTHRDANVCKEQLEALQKLSDRRLAGEPIQYITGETEFYGLPFRVTRDVLIPRPETEHLVERVIELAASFAAPRIVDVGTGSGAIAVALACQLPHAAITATDVSGSALAVAHSNAEHNNVARQIRFVEGDLLATFADEQFDIVVSNPPYVPEADRASLAVEVREYEPALALFAGEDGLEVYRRLIPAAFAALASGGFIALEIGYGQSAAVAELFTASGFHQIEFLPDLQNIPRVACAKRPG